MAVSPDVPWLVAVGSFAQLVDGCVGMGYGISASSILATLGVPPAITSATGHAAETVTAGVSSASHARFRNVDRRKFFSLLLPGVLGGMLGATLLAHVPTHRVRPLVWAYLLPTRLVRLGRLAPKPSAL